MVFEFIDFLLGKKQKKKPQKNTQAAEPMNNGQDSGSNNQGGGNQDNSANASQGNAQGNANASSGGGQQGGKKSVSEAVSKLNEELKSSNDKLTSLVSDFKSLESTVNNLGHRLDDLEESKKSTDEKINEIDANMSKFLSLYEVVNNQYNPFVTQDSMPQGNGNQQVAVDANGSSVVEEDSGEDEQQSPNRVELPQTVEEATQQMGGKQEEQEDPSPARNTQKQAAQQQTKDLDAALLELDTLDIEEAAGSAVPLTHIKTNTNSLVTILSWLEYLIKRVGIEEARNALRYYTEVLRWITPEVFFELDKYLKGMHDKKDLTGDERLNIRDHIVSLYFISKLNEKSLDEKLTNAVLQIIRQQ